MSQNSPLSSKEVNPWDLIADKAIQQLVFGYEMVLTEMRTHARAARTGSALKEWVARLDQARDEFVREAVKGERSPDETECGLCAAGMNSFTDPDTGIRIHARNGTVTPCSAQKAGASPALMKAAATTDAEHIRRLEAAMRNLVHAARTSGGIAGRDEYLCQYCTEAEEVLAWEYGSTASPSKVGE